MNDHETRLGNLEKGHRKLAKELKELGTTIKKIVSKPSPKPGAKKKA